MRARHQRWPSCPRLRAWDVASPLPVWPLRKVAACQLPHPPLRPLPRPWRHPCWKARCRLVLQPATCPLRILCGRPVRGCAGRRCGCEAFARYRVPAPAAVGAGRLALCPRTQGVFIPPASCSGVPACECALLCFCCCMLCTRPSPPSYPFRRRQGRGAGGGVRRTHVRARLPVPPAFAPTLQRCRGQRRKRADEGAAYAACRRHPGAQGCREWRKQGACVLRCVSASPVCSGRGVSCCHGRQEHSRPLAHIPARPCHARCAASAVRHMQFCVVGCLRWVRPFARMR
jgi:hypothetical protein